MLRIIIAGEGGQGVQSISEILVTAVDNLGKYASYIPSFGVEQRGGVSLAYLQIDDKPIKYPKFPEADIVVAMCDRAIERIKPFISEKTVLIFDGTNISDELIQTLQGKAKKYLNLPVKISMKSLSPKVANIYFLGALLNFAGGVNVEVIKNTIEQRFAKYIAKKPELKDLNFRALEMGLNFAKNPQNQEFKGVARVEVQKIFEDEKKSWERFPEYCKGCGLCIVRCPVQALSFSNDLNFLGTQTPQVDPAKCTACMLCQHTCPDGAIKVTKKA